jgi:hypothetical protein
MGLAQLELQTDVCGPRTGSAERADNFSVSGLRESLQRLRAYETEGANLQDEPRHNVSSGASQIPPQSNSPITM